MTTNLWRNNTPSNFWQPRINIPKTQWREATLKALSALGLSQRYTQLETVLEHTLGEAQFGDDHWNLGYIIRIYYSLKPFLPRKLSQSLRRFNRKYSRNDFPLGWPIEDRFARFQWEVMRQLLLLTNLPEIPFTYFWPNARKYALVITHDVETAKGQALVQKIADYEANLGLRSSFNFVPERYPLDYSLLQELKELNFEIGVHGLKHDGKLFTSYKEFQQRAKRINHYMHEFGAVGFRAPLTHRQPHWLQDLDLEYDLSFFDTDPFEPVPGGTMSIWPFELGRFIELPYTLVQDYTLHAVLGEKTPRLWLEKINFIKTFHGMALINTHPDYLVNSATWELYTEFLKEIIRRGDYWHALPRDVARWWRRRRQVDAHNVLPGSVRARVRLEKGNIRLVIDG